MKQETEVIEKKEEDLVLKIDSMPIYTTKDYTIFTRKEGNRERNPSLVNKLYNSIIANGYYDVSILVVGEDMTMLDGQHRLEALTRVWEDTGEKYEVKYIISRDFDDLSKIISWQKDRAAWTTLDYARSYATMGNENYQTYLDFRAKYKLKHTIGIILLQGSSGAGWKTENFRMGKFMVEDYARSEEWALKLQSLSEYYDFAYNRSFVQALMHYWRHPEFSHREFMEKVDKFRNLLYNCVNVQQFSDLIGELYNYRRSSRKVKFDFDEK